MNYISTDQLSPDVERIKARIDLMGLKRKYVAKKVNVTEQWLSYVMNGKEVMTDELRSKIFNCLGLS